MKEVFFSDYLEKKAKKSLAACLAWTGVGLALLLAGIAIGIAVVVMSGMVAVMIALAVAATRSPEYTAYWYGIWGERVFRAHLLAWGLSDDYTAYYNLPLNGGGRTSDVDCVLVGPSGLFVFEVKHHHGLILYRNGIWSRFKVGQRGTLYLGEFGDPSGQLYRNIRRLKELLGKTNGLWFNGAVVFTNQRAVLDVEGLRWVRAIALKSLEQILSKRTVLSTEQIEKINARLSALARK